MSGPLPICLPEPLYAPQEGARSAQRGTLRPKGIDLTSKRTTNAHETALFGILPGDGWVIERIEDDNVHTVFPLVGWLVTADGQVHPLPSTDSTWTVRPRTADDERLIAASATRLRSTPTPRSFQ